MGGHRRLAAWKMTTRRRFYAPASSFEPGTKSVILPLEEARHLRDVLRLRPGDAAFIFDGEGIEYECTVSEVRRDFAQLKIVSEVPAKSLESPVEITLAVALLKGEKFDLVVQKSTELGVYAILPVATRFADIRLKDHRSTEHRMTRWRRIALEATKQSGRARVPRVLPPTDLAGLFQTSTTDRACLMFSERLGTSFEEAVTVIGNPTSITALVGSEGGWADVLDILATERLKSRYQIGAGHRAIGKGAAGLGVRALEEPLDILS